MTTRSLLPIALGTALVLVTYVTPMATVPRTAADLGAGPVARAWILSSMSVGLAAALLAAGVLGDAFGRRRVYAAGLGAIGVGAFVCAAAQEPVLFVAARVVEGVGGAAVLACGLAVLAHDFAPGAARVHATSIWGASVGLGITAGAVLSAALDVGSGWRETYAVVGVLALLLLLPSLQRVGESSAADPRRIDVPGLALLVAAMTLLVSALTQGRNGIDAPTVVLAMLAVLAATGFALVERRVAQPLVDPDLLRGPRFRAATLGSLTLGLGIIGMSSFVPTVAQVGLGASLWTASLLVAVWSGTSVVTSYLIRHLRHPLEGPRPVAALLVVVALGQLTGYGLDASSSAGRLAVPMFVAGLATGVLNALLGREAVASVPPDRAAMGSGANNTARYLGAACGITLFVVVATHAGADLLEGWNVAVLVAAALSLLGAATIAWSGRGRA
ncbi:MULTISPECIES: MFS transporter [unclassified Nocardioides]|uniref:MFS transporter n=1 Tax=unclassified Nocardioides TaxID=2615069 RepID=UPI0009F0FFF9|nr:MULTISPECIES: MFS transporter [unclassified Nocardioides]GAW48288.1 Transmembrane efflux protein [Nocardioides sp. PD653-B2]GAW52936.1 Transmembrane efflux protein [Nocardioides sp. PD653]